MERKLAHALQAFTLSRESLWDVRDALRARIQIGLARDATEIQALPAFLALPETKDPGRVLAIDVGGTHMRAAIVERDAARRWRLAAGPKKERVLRRHDALLDRAAFFGAQAELCATLCDAPIDLPVGYVFSYPAVSTPNHDARLIAWTKDVWFAGVVGTLVGEGLHEALVASGVRPTKMVVLNDTVAALLCGAQTSADALGVVVGTGTNMAMFIDRARLVKLPEEIAWVGPMAVNLESGNFTPPHLTLWDDALDAESQNPGSQRFEKAVGGYYLAQLFALVAGPRTGFDASRGAVALADVLAQTGDEDARKLARAIVDRAADLVAASIAAAIDVSCTHGTMTEVADRGIDVHVVAEGGLFWGTLGFSERVAATLDAMLLGSSRRVTMAREFEPNLVGAALAALSVARI